MISQNKIRIILSTLICGLTIGVAVAFQKSNIPPVGKKQPTEKRYSTFTSTGEFDSNYKTGITTARNITYTDSDLIVLADYGKDFDKTKEMVAEGHLSLDDAKQHVTADKIHVYDEASKKLAVITGNVIIKLKPSNPKPVDPKLPVTIAPVIPPKGNIPAKVEPAKSGEKRNITIFCDIAEYSYKKRFLVLKGHLKFVQIITNEDGTQVTRTFLSEHAEYDMEAEQMILFPPSTYSDSEGKESEFSGKLKVTTTEGEESMSGVGLKARLPVKEEEETPPKKQP